MIIITDTNSQRLAEILQPAGNSQLQILKKQMAGNEELARILTTPIEELPQYQFLTDEAWIKRGSLLMIIEYSLRLPGIESYFMKTSKGIYIGYIAVKLKLENRQTIVDDIKLFSFGLSPKEDENMIRRDAPNLLDICLKKYPKVSWSALKANKANIAYEIYRKRRKGEKEDLGNAWRYTCYGK